MLLRRYVMLLPPGRVLCKALIDNPSTAEGDSGESAVKKTESPRILEIVPLEVSKMNRLTRLTRFVAGAAVVAALAAPAVVQADNQDDIAYRQAVMKTLGQNAASIGMILQNKAPAENFATHAQILAIAASAGVDAFTPKVAGGESKPDVWAKWDDFSKKMNDFAAATADLAKTAAADPNAAKGKVQATLGQCKGCHDAYRDHK